MMILPSGIVKIIISFLDTKSALNLSETSIYFCKLVDHEGIRIKNRKMFVSEDRVYYKLPNNKFDGTYTLFNEKTFEITCQTCYLNGKRSDINLAYCNGSVCIYSYYRDDKRISRYYQHYCLGKQIIKIDKGKMVANMWCLDSLAYETQIENEKNGIEILPGESY